MVLSRRVIDSIKTGAAVSIAHGIAPSLDREQPRWSAVTVTLVSLATMGQSLNNAVERILGTRTAGSMTLLLVALFGQERWSHTAALSVWMAFCTYLMGGRRFEESWRLSGFATDFVATQRSW